MIARLRSTPSDDDPDPIEIELRIDARRRLTYAEIKEIIVRVAILLVDEEQIGEVCGQLAESQPIRLPPAPAKKLKRVK